MIEPKEPAIHADRWEMRFKQLVRFKNKYNHCNVSTRWSENRELGRWVGVQRKLYRLGKLSLKRLTRLKKIGFTFEPREIHWQEMYIALMKFKKKFGHCNVPDNFSKDPKLAHWVEYQRIAFKKETLSNDKIDKLRKLDFVWEMHNKSWEKMYNRLIIFKNQWGHCKVPYNWKKDQQLSQWVYRQRSYKNKGMLKTERIRLLNKIGFDWARKRV